MATGFFIGGLQCVGGFYIVRGVREHVRKGIGIMIREKLEAWEIDRGDNVFFNGCYRFVRSAWTDDNGDRHFDLGTGGVMVTHPDSMIPAQHPFDVTIDPATR